MTGVFRGEKTLQRDTEGKTPCEAEAGGTWVYRSRATKDASDYLSGGEHGTDSLSGPQGAPCRHPDFKMSGLTNNERINFCNLCHLVGG